MHLEGWLGRSCVITAQIVTGLISFFYPNKRKETREAAEHSASASSQSLSLSRSQPKGWDYEVFLSYRGPETGTGFTDYLYNDLMDAGIRTFRDKEELRVGEEIGSELLQAIQSSKVSIPIFSKDYASSKWCLMELAHILECKKLYGQMIFPIFYNVEPRDVRHQGGTYNAAFRQHEKQFDEKTVKQWRETLNEVAELKGLELKKIANGHEGSLVKMVVKKVWRELKNSNSMIVSDSLVGIDYHLKEMKKLLDVNSGDVRMVGIHGMGGIGKTTIARVIYNHFSKRFEYCCFLVNVREYSSQHRGLVDLQNILISNILNHRSLSVATLDQGINVISETFSKKKVLIVLDDVDKREQLDALAQKHAWFGFGSRIIITTRNKEILDVHQVDGFYEPEKMNTHEALQLLCKHAFKCDHPPEDFLELSENIASTTDGLPLALEVTGSFLYARSKDVWEHTWKKLKSIPHERVQEKLRLSYNELSHEQKQIFLDIACLFIGADKRTVVHMWDDCRFYPENSIEVLILRSLVKVGGDNELIMHDQLRDLGREIVREENLHKPEERSRLWSHDEALKVIQGSQGTEKVEALCLDFKAGPGNSRLTNMEFEKLQNIRFLQMDCANLEGDFEGLLRSLRWLRWREIPNNFTPQNFDLENLVILDLSCGNLTNDWEGWIQLKVAKKLKVLNLSHCPIARTPDFYAYLNLVELNLKGCESLVNIHPSIWDLEYLKRLNISGTGITALPRSIGMLKKLEELHASDCLNLSGKVPNDIGKLKCLRVLNMANSKISRLPSTMFLLHQLKTLNLYGMEELQDLPELPWKLLKLHVTLRTATSCSNLLNLEELEVLFLFGWLELLQVPIEICAFSRLYDLTIKQCTKLQFILGLPTRLVNLQLDECPELLVINLENLKFLEHLHVFGCEKLSSLDGLENLTSLTALRVRRCASIQRLPDLSNLKELDDLTVSKCMKLTGIQGLYKLRSLSNVVVKLCPETLFLSILQQVLNLDKFETFWGLSIDEIEHAKIISVLRSLKGPCTVYGRLSWPLSDGRKCY